MIPSRKTSSQNKLAKRLQRNTGRAIGDFNMIGAGDRVMVCLSGGKDSYGMLDILINLRNNAPIDFELVAVNLEDPSQREQLTFGVGNDEGAAPY